MDPLDKEVPSEQLMGSYLNLSRTLREGLLQKNAPKEVYELAHALLELGKAQESLSVFRFLLRQYPEFPSNKSAHCHFQLGRCHFLLRDFQSAAGSFSRALELKESPQYASCLA